MAPRIVLRKSLNIMQHPTKSIFTFGSALLALLALLACSPSTPPTSTQLNNLVLALEPDKDPEQLVADQKTLADYLSNATSMQTDVIIPMSGAVIREGLRNGTIDVAFVSSTVAVRLEDDGIAGVLLATLIDGKPHYHSYWLALAEKEYQGVEDLRGKPIAFASKTSTSGCIIPLWDLHKRNLITIEGGPESFFGAGNVSYGVGYVSAVERVLQGRAEAAAVSYYVYEKDKHLSPEQRQQLKVIASQGPVPSHVLVVRSSLSSNTKTTLQALLLALNEQAPALRDRVFGSPLVQVDPQQHLAVTRDALQLVEQMTR
jgi:phosphonate transport system substrate-binding protein